MAIATTGNIRNLSGDLYTASDGTTPFLDAIWSRGKAGGRRISHSQEFIVSNSYELRAPFQPDISEDDSIIAPPPVFTGREQAANVVQIYHRTIAVTYVAQGNFDALDGVNLANQSNNVQDELGWQTEVELRNIRRDLNFTTINGVYQFTRGNTAVAPRSRGVIPSITENLFPASGATLTIPMINDALKNSIVNGLVATGIELWVNPQMLNVINEMALLIPGQSQPATRTEAGVAIVSILTNYGWLPVYHDAMIPEDVILGANIGDLAIVEKPYDSVGVSRNAFGALFIEPLGKRGASEEHQIFGEMGTDHGFENRHFIIDLR